MSPGVGVHCGISGCIAKHKPTLFGAEGDCTISPAKTAAERKADERQRHKEAGRTAVTVHVRPEYVPEVPLWVRLSEGLGRGGCKWGNAGALRLCKTATAPRATRSSWCMKKRIGTAPVKLGASAGLA